MRIESQDRSTVLIVDDDAGIRRVLKRVLETHGHSTVEAASASQAKARMATHAPEVVLLDIGLPDGSGLDPLRALLDQAPEVAVVMVSGETDPRVARSAVDIGAYGYIAKPFCPDAVLIAVYNARRRRDLERANHEQQVALTCEVADRTKELETALERLGSAMEDAHRSYNLTIERLSLAIDYRDHETAGHVRRMSHLCGRLARQLGLDEETYRTAGSMHDIGKIGVPDAVLLKSGRLDAEERRVMERHTLIGHDLLSGSGSAGLDLAAVIALAHHERWDGSGYPFGLKGTAIPLAGRIAAVADVFDAITQPRAYRSEVLSPAQALAYMREEQGAHFDPMVVDALLADVSTEPEAPAIAVSADRWRRPTLSV